MSDRSITPRDRPALDPMDAMIEAMQGVAIAVRELRNEVNDMTSKLTEKIEAQAGRIDGLARASGDLAAEVREFGRSKERLLGRVALLESIEAERAGNGHA